MLELALNLAGGMAGGIAGGGLVALVLSRSTRSSVRGRVDPGAQPIISGVDDQIEEVASEWARGVGRPEAAGLVANKLRLWHRLQARRRTSSQTTGWLR